MEDIIKILKKNDIDLVVTKLKDDGFCLVESKAIFVDCDLNEQRTVEVILHEAEHILSHSDYIELYRASFVYHSKMEAAADSYMINSFIEANNNQFNYSMLMEEFGIGIGYDTRYQKLT